MSKVIDLTDQTFEAEVLRSEIPILVDFWAPWCGPCQMMAPVLDQLSEELDGKIRIAKLDVENPAHQALATQYQIQSIPSMKLFKNGEIAKEFVGFRDKDSLIGDLTAEI